MIEFSAVVHTFNRKDFLSETLRSIERQTHTPAEVIVVDDGSTDNTQEMVKTKFPDFSYLRIANSGCGAARKAGAEFAKKDWIAFCDDDDIWLPEHLERRAKLIDRFPEVGFTFSNFGAFGTTANSSYVHFDKAPNGWWETASDIIDGDFCTLKSDAYLHFFAFYPAYPTTWAVRRDLYHAIGGINPRYSRWQSEDTDFSRRCALATKLGGDRMVTAMYRRHGSNMSSTMAKNFLSRADIVYEHTSSGIVPSEFIPFSMDFVRSSREIGHFQAFWSRDLALMRKALASSPEISRDYRIMIRHLFGEMASLLGLSDFKKNKK